VQYGDGKSREVETEKILSNTLGEEPTKHDFSGAIVVSRALRCMCKAPGAKSGFLSTVSETSPGDPNSVCTQSPPMTAGSPSENNMVFTRSLVYTFFPTPLPPHTQIIPGAPVLCWIIQVTTEVAAVRHCTGSIVGGSKPFLASHSTSLFQKPGALTGTTLDSTNEPDVAATASCKYAVAPAGPTSNASARPRRGDACFSGRK
jgi:hypothetical protein